MVSGHQTKTIYWAKINWVRERERGAVVNMMEENAGSVELEVTGKVESGRGS